MTVTVVSALSSASAHESAIPSSANVEWVQVDETELEGAIADARSRGGVVVMARRPEMETLLSLGVDEAVSADCDPAMLKRAIDAARARAVCRRTEMRGRAGEELGGLALLGAAMAHEIRNPLAAATFNFEVLAQFVPSMTKLVDLVRHNVGDHEADKLLSTMDMGSVQDVREALVDLGSALRSVAHVVGQMAEFSTRSSTDVCDLASAMVELASVLHQDVEKVADFTVELPDHPCIVAWSRARAMEVVSAIVSNSMRSFEAGTNPKPEVVLRLTSEPSMLVLEISDNGCGMPPDVRRRALNPFFTTRRPGALGLGLTFAALQIQRAGGEIMIDSAVGEGTNVRLFFPNITAPVKSTEPSN